MSDAVTVMERSVPVELEIACAKAQALVSHGGAKVIAGLQQQNAEKLASLFDELVTQARSVEPGKTQNGLYGLAIRCSATVGSHYQLMMSFSKAISAANLAPRTVSPTFGLKLESTPVLPENVTNPEPKI